MKVVFINVIALIAITSCSYIDAKNSEKEPTMNSSLIKKNPTNLLSVKLEISIKSKDIFANVLFQNTSSKDAVYLAKYEGASNDQLMSSVFKIKFGENKISYIGMLAKIKPTEDSYIKLLPLQKFSAKIKIDESYAFLSGEHEYEITYKGYHDSLDKLAAGPAISNTVIFKYKKPI